MELNPEHPVTIETRDLWHKMVALLMIKFNNHHVEITEADVALLGDMEKCVVVESKGETIHLDLVSWEEGERRARESGGLPN